MYWDDLLAAFALYLVIEGVLPFLSPRGWKQSIEIIGQLNDGQLRLFGLISMIAGLLLLVFVRG
ncbi:MAG: DUF2065 domain-containing protein [Gammaproteobacteria bacterium]|nr:DUF2065 domain-containing protein [Gammaproteobacteria bacterium]